MIQLFNLKTDPDKKTEKCPPASTEKPASAFCSDKFEFFKKKTDSIPLLNFSKEKVKSEKPADVDQVTKKFNELTKKLDPDNNGFVTKRELVKLVNDKS